MLGYSDIEPPFEIELSPKTRLENPWAPRLLVASADEIAKMDQGISVGAAWCGDCHSSTCQEGPGSMDMLGSEGFAFSRCPLQNEMPTWLKEASLGNYKEAHKVDARTNDIMDITGAACPSQKLCEGGCMLPQAGRKASHIARTERSLAEMAWEQGWVKPIERLADTFEGSAKTTVEGADRLQVSMVGTGVAVHEPMKVFLENSADVTAYDGKDVPGGITHWAIPTTKLERHAYRRHTDRLAAGGAKYVLNTRVGDTQFGSHVTWDKIAFEEVAEKSDVVFIATGLQSFNYLPTSQLSWEKQASFIQGIDLLETQNQVLDGRDAKNSEAHQTKGQDIVVVGTGDTAWDVVATALRQEANKITVLVRRDKLEGLDQEDLDKIFESGEINVKDKEIRSGLEEAAYIAKQRGVCLRDVLNIRLGTEIADSEHENGVEHLTLKTPGLLNDHVTVDKVVLALGSKGHDLKEQFGFSNDNFKMKKNGVLSVTPYHTAEERSGILGKGSGYGGGLVGIYQTESGRKVPVFAVGDVTRDNQGLTGWSDEDALIVNAYRDGINVLPDAFSAVENPERFVSWAENNKLALNYS